ncbi:cytosine permease [Burkholderia sp. Bp9090]|uniref:purine-cytosine permease family protein n=1 Tax=unclassified Burkholderia TaxID=2613784 RepID=UPI000F58AECF|nr:MULTISPECIES: cytosine permease [unclassified Burkholderia]RQR74438.1 cytosine permease [Burkholderia sp. Bp9011]RQR85013.1 cytosine permease [Burkholderia sp. Bp9010]RQR99028.1 cytosine permease [Burkholderia sp. Bp8991]RQS33511.1 cytosine permease [Burkholderia sp. Bp8990]RQS48657.1 cytosine permease [Burkholderia sp. Bp8986]
MTKQESDGSVLAIESNSIEYVPPEARHGKPADLFTLWFCTNVAPLAVISGATSVLVFHLDLMSAIVAIAAGQFFGAIFHALTSAQGPLVGAPQMIQSRAQFGRYGSLLVVCFTTLIYLGFFVSNIILAGKTLHTAAPAVPVPIATVIGAVLATLVGVIGCHFIHRFNKIGAWFMGGALLIGIALMVPGLDARMFQQGHFDLANWFAMFGLCAVWQISFAPYTSDYSRYLPASAGFGKTFAYTYLGTSLGTIFAFLFGVLAVSTGHSTDAMQAIREQTGAFGYVLIFLFLVNIIGHNGMNLYGAVLSFITAAQTFRPHWVPGRNVRVVVSAVLLVASTAAALWASSNFISIFLNAIFALRIVLAPWIAINLIDFYLVNNRRYRVTEIISSSGGVYGAFNVRAIAIYAFGIAVQVPFMEESFFHGAWASVLGGADVSWMVGLVVTATVCYLFASKDGSRSRGRCPAGAGALE